jgi:hypothetical protein
VVCGLFHCLMRKVKSIKTNRHCQSYRKKDINQIPTFSDISIQRIKPLSIRKQKGDFYDFKYYFKALQNLVLLLLLQERHLQLTMLF